MHIERFFVPGLAHVSYVVASGPEAVIAIYADPGGSGIPDILLRAGWRPDFGDIPTSHDERYPVAQRWKCDAA
jgi:hypothetical protein